MVIFTLCFLLKQKGEREMETPLQAINRQIKDENTRHSGIIADLERRKNQENILHQQKMQQLNSRKEQIKRTAKLEYMEETLDKVIEGLE